MSFRAMWRALAALLLCSLAVAGGAAAAGEGRGIDPNQGENLVEGDLTTQAAAVRLQFEGESYGVDFNDHYLRRNRDGSVTVTVFGTEQELQALEAAGYDVGTTIEGPATWRARTAARQAYVRGRA